MASMILSRPNPKLIKTSAVRIYARVVRSADARLRVLASSVLALLIRTGRINHYQQDKNRDRQRHPALIPIVQDCSISALGN